MEKNYVLIRQPSFCVGIMEHDNVLASSTNLKLLLGLAYDDILQNGGESGFQQWKWTILTYNNLTGALIDSIAIDSLSKVAA